MHFATSAILLAGLAAAQSNVVKIVRIPQGGFTVGEAGTIGWSTTDTTDPVEIVLKEPDAANPAVLNPNPIATVVAAANPTLSSIEFKPTACGTSVALEILQGQETNYVGPFNIGGACSTTSAASAPTYGSTTSSASSAIITSSSAVNYNITTSFASNFTTTSAPAGPSSYKPSVIPYRNTTLATTAATTASAGGPVASTSAPIPANPNSAAGISSPLVLVFGIVAALAYLA